MSTAWASLQEVCAASCTLCLDPWALPAQQSADLLSSGKGQGYPYRSFRRQQAARRKHSRSRPPPELPGLLPMPKGPPSTEKEQAAMDQLVLGMSDEERVQMAAAIEAQNDALLTEYFTTMAPEKQQRLLESLRINKHYEQLHVWEEMLVEPIMKDMMRENLGPELSAIMDKLLGGPGWADAHRPRSSPLPLSEVRYRLSQLEPWERERVPELFAELEDWQRAYDKMGKIAAADQAEEEKAKRIGRARLKRLARQKGLADPTLEEQDGEEDWEADDVDENDDDDDDEGDAARIREDGMTTSGSGSSSSSSSSRGKKGAPRLSRRAARRAAKRASRADPALAAPANGALRSNSRAEEGQGVGGGSRTGGEAGMSGAQQQEGKPLFEKLALMQSLLEQSGVLAEGPESAGMQGENNGSVTGSVGFSGNRGGEASSSGGGSSRGDAAGGKATVGVRNTEALKEAALAAGLSSEMADLVGRLEHTIRRYSPGTGRGWEEEGYLGSPDMRCLQRVAMTLAYASRLRDRKALEAEGISVSQLASTLEEAFGELQALMERWHRGFVQDGPTVSCLIFIETQLLQPSSDADAAGSMELPVDPEVMDELISFIRAAQSFEAVVFFAQGWEDRHPNMPIATAFERYGYVQGQENGSDSDPEFVGGYCTLWWAARDQDAYGVEPDTVRQPLVADWDKIDGLAAMDAIMLRCCAELEAQDYSQEVLMKWSLHPEVGPRLRSGEPLLQPEDLPKDMQPMFAQAMGWSVEGLDYQVEMLRSSDPRARPAAARLQRELARLEAQLSEEPGAAGSEQQQNQQDSQAQEQQQQDRGTDGVVASREWGAGLAQGGGGLGTTEHADSKSNSKDGAAWDLAVGTEQAWAQAR
eukprot:CAMPEP_0202422292 /NCGR_PEP_ID=MMETSP1128-20130828/50782_1 /ASSEMBLY_ACC=CAM_ASM_000463 /TAXON_ID=3047 /ORGANISM="Dunaliella tertiolecta, Strain CCMP1320" /LENGTH=871 /DNA_ID=CAMNT_0049030347 /DNA_START=10 /DNA_END=2623 /DNA_ORIENTATION=-